jgi:lysophospholipase L1-like esterase
VNAWIRSSGTFDAVVDFDQAVRDPADPRRVLAAYDSGDHLHPNDAGYQAMADAVPLDEL